MNKKKKLILVFSLIAPLLAFGYGIFYARVGQKQDKAEEEFYKGHLVYQNYHYRAAADFFTKSLSYNPEFTLARRMLGQALYFSGLTDEAFSEWNIILENGGYDPPLKFHLQKMRSVQLNQEPRYVFRGALKSKTGFRFSWPVFVGNLPNHHMIMLSLNSNDPEKPDGNLIEIDANGEFLRNFRRISGRLEAPMGAAYGGGTLWVSDYLSDKIHRFDYKKGFVHILTNPLPSIPLQKKDPKNPDKMLPPDIKLRGPAGICHANGYFFVADSHNNRVVKFSEDGKALSVFSKTDTPEGLQEPFSVACASPFGIYVSIPNEGRIALFDEYGNFMKYLTHPELKKPRHLSFSEAGDRLLIADEETGVLIYTPSGNTWRVIRGYTDENSQEQEFLRAYSVVEDFFGNLYVADYARHSILRFTPEMYEYSNLELWIERVDASNFPTIAVWASAKDHNGRYLTDLSGDNFRIVENDAEMGRLSGSYLKQFADQSSWVILLDKTASMKNFQNSLEWVLDFFIQELRVKDRVKMISYTSETREETDWIHSRLQLRKALTNHNDTDFASDDQEGLLPGLNQSITELLPQKGKRAVIWITDGERFPEDNIKVTQLQNYARVNHVPVFIISFETPDSSSADNIQKLRQYAEYTNGKYYPAFSSSLRGALSDLRAIKEERIVLLYSSGADSSWHRQYMDIRLDLNFRGSKGYETAGYFVP